jgi:hypothetical protein
MSTLYIILWLILFALWLNLLWCKYFYEKPKLIKTITIVCIVMVLGIVIYSEIMEGSL